MKSSLILLSFLAVAFGKIVPRSHENEDQKIIDTESAQYLDSYYSNLLNMFPGNREMFLMSMGRNNQGYPSDMMGMQGPMDYMQNGYYPGMGMNYPMMNFPIMGSYPGYYQQMRSSDNCGCAEICPPCLPWFPCNPCSCPCQNNPTSPPVDSNSPDTTIETTTITIPTTTTVLTTVTQEITQPPNNCVPCTPCIPCSPIWWLPCNPNCNCNDGCQTNSPETTTQIVEPIKFYPTQNNCQCICAPCPPWSDCPVCPKNCPCY